MEKVYTSIKEVRKEFFPRDYQKILIDERDFGELAKYLIKKDIELDYELNTELSPEEVGTLLAEISIEKIVKPILN